MELALRTAALASRRSRRFLVVLGLCLGIIATTEPAAPETDAPASALDQSARQAASASFREFVELLAIPNDQQVPADIQKNAEWLVHAFQRRGFAARELANGDKPMVFAEYGAPGAKQKTVLFYIHFDGQPVVAAEWKQESPWKATLKRRNAQGTWEAMPLENLYGKDVDPEWRLFARSASDDKGPILMFLAAMDALRAARRPPAVHVKVILDSEEEKFSPGLARVFAENGEVLRADAIVIIDGPKHETNQPTLAFGNKGLVTATLKVFGPRNDLHSGHYGGYAPNPAQHLATLLATMKDDNGRVTIPGFYDGVQIDEAAKRVLSAVPDDESALKKRLGIAQSDKVAASYQEALQYPTLNVRGLAAADVGVKVRGVVPESAVAEIDMRTTPEASPDRLLSLLEKHVTSQGYHLVQDVPTEEERATFPKLASLTHPKASSQSYGVRTDPDGPVGRWLTGALRASFGRDPIRIRMMGGTLPSRAMADSLHSPFVILPLVNPDNSQHAANENVRLGNYFDGVKCLIGVLSRPL